MGIDVCDEGPVYPMEAQIHNLVDQVRINLSERNFRLTPRLDFDFLCKFVRAKKYNVEKAADAIYRFYEHIYKNMDILKGIKPSDHKAVIESQAFVILRKKVEGTKVVYSRVKFYDRKKVSLKDYLKYSVLLMEEVLKDVTIQPNGAIAIIDMEGLGLSIVRDCIPYVQFILHMAQEGLPMRANAIHIVNAPSIFWTFHKVYSLLVDEKLRKRLHVHENYESLHERISPTKLPICLGGTLSDEEAIDTELIQQLLKHDTCYDDIWNGGSRIN